MPARDRLHPSDLALIDVDVAEDGASGCFRLAPGLTRHDGALYGGTGLAVSVMAMEAATGRDVLWATTQFVSSPSSGTDIDWTVDVLAEGRRTSQVLVRATAGDAVAFVALGAVGVSKDDGLTGQYRQMPDATPPADGAPWGGAFEDSVDPQSWTLKIDLRTAELRGPTTSSALWARRRDGLPFTPAAIGFAADFVPLGVARSAGKLGAGSSLDNSMRFRPGESTEWVLLELHGDFASGGYGHGIVLVWGQDGTLVASGSQTASMKYLWGEDETPKLPLQG
jgi:acyl-CoA thioesterase